MYNKLVIVTLIRISFLISNYLSHRGIYRNYLAKGTVPLSKRLDKCTVLLLESSIVKLFRIKVRILILNQKHNNLL